MIGWSFPPNNDGTTSGFNDGAIDTFAGNRLSSIVREIIQNSLDARKNKEEPVRLCFKLDEIKKGIFDGFHGIEPHLKNSRKMAKEQNLNHVVEYYERALKSLKKRTNVPVLSIHDFNTSGLTGPVDKPVGAWSALVKGAGITQKNSPGSLGSFGHGSKAPFSFSQIRSVFYYTKIAKGNNKFEERFQGKSILQTHESPVDKNSLTQATGFFGYQEKLKPLLNEEVPKWAKDLRNQVTEDTGTSIFVPFTEFREDLYPETRITVIANFYYAIKTGALEVTVNNDLITEENVDDWFHDCRDILVNEQDEIDVQHVENCFQSIATIIEAGFKGRQVVPGFGEFEWYLRINDDLEKRVGIARSSGMLITRKAPMLEVFRNIKSFDMFVCVREGSGSEFLKRLENPTHDNFEFDRIQIPDEKRAIKSKYNSFQKRVREVLNNYASVDIEEEESVDSLGKLFSMVSDGDQNLSDHFERGTVLLIRDGQYKKSSPSTQIDGNSGLTNQGQALGEGKRGGTGNVSNTGGTIESPSGTKEIIAQKSSADDSKGETYKAQNLRVRHSSSSDNRADLFFNSPVSGTFHLRVSRVGEHAAEKVKFKVGGEQVNELLVNLDQSERASLKVQFTEKVNHLAIEASLTEVEKIDEA